jgi:hypothetical protein
MEFKIDNSKSPCMPLVLGISPEREEEIFVFLEDLYDKMRSDGAVIKLLSGYYKALAEFCNNVEEYAFAMHNLIFNLANIGHTIDSMKLKN